MIDRKKEMFCNLVTTTRNTLGYCSRMVEKRKGLYWTIRTIKETSM